MRNGFDAEHDERESQDIALVLMGHSLASIRIAALSLITYHSTLKNRFSLYALEHLPQYLPYFHTEINPRYRNEFIVIMKRICTRLEREFSAQNKSREIGPPSSAPDSMAQRDVTYEQPVLDKHLSFSKWYIEFLLQELQPTASYQRHITALKLLEFFLVEGSNTSNARLFSSSRIIDLSFIEGNAQFFNSRFIRLTLDLIMDPFDDVRHAASALSHLVLWTLCRMNNSPWTQEAKESVDNGLINPNTLWQENYHAGILDVLCRAQSITYRTGRADHADGMGRLYYLLYESCQNFDEFISSQSIAPTTIWSSSGRSIVNNIMSELKRDILITSRNLRKAIGNTRIHGNLVALR